MMSTNSGGGGESGMTLIPLEPANAHPSETTQEDSVPGQEKPQAADTLSSLNSLPQGYEEVNVLQKARRMCSYQGNGTADDPPCTKVAASKGLCRAHGGGSRCNAEGCGKFSVRMGFCKQHAKENGFHRTAEQITFERMKNMCSFIDSNGNQCTKQAITKKLCSTHGGKKRCKDVTDGVTCTKHVFTSGYCLLHARKHNLHNASHTKRRCSYVFTDVNGHESRCTRFSEAHSLCYTHRKKRALPSSAEPKSLVVDSIVSEYVHQSLVEQEARGMENVIEVEHEHSLDS